MDGSQIGLKIILAAAIAACLLAILIATYPQPQHADRTSSLAEQRRIEGAAPNHHFGGRSPTLGPMSLFESKEWLASRDRRHAEAREVGATRYLEAYLQKEQAEKLEDAGRLPEALDEYRRARDGFRQVALDYPNWEFHMVTYRIRKLEEAVNRLEREIASSSS